MCLHNWVQFLALYCSYRNYRTSSKVCLEIQFSIIFSKFEKCWYCLYLIYKWIFFFFFFSFVLQSTFVLSKISHFPIFMTLSPLGLLAILKIFLYSSSYAYFWQLLPPFNTGGGLWQNIWNQIVREEQNIGRILLLVSILYSLTKKQQHWISMAGKKRKIS